MIKQYALGFSGYIEGSVNSSIGRHRVALNRLGGEFCPGPSPPWSFRPRIHLEMQGRFTEVPTGDRIVATRFYRDGLASVDITISSKTQLLPEEEFRDCLIKLVSEGCDSIVARAKKKKIDFDAVEFLAYINSVLTAYKALSLPLPPTQAELDFASKWIGIPQEPEDSQKG